MPVQRTLWGRPVSVPRLPRRFQIVLTLTAIIVTLLVVSSRSSVHIPETPLVQDLRHTAERAAHRLSSKTLPTLWNPFEKAAHKPPAEQANSTLGGSSWLSDWKWLNPFSSSIALDENRAVLPPLSPRPTIYTFYDSKGERPQDVLDAEHELLLTWRRAWWAQGFKPIVLGKPEAMNNPLFERLQRLDMSTEMEKELHRWLAWGHMKGGILANWLTLPMAPFDHVGLSRLRRGEIDKLTRYEGLQSGLFFGPKEEINDAIKEMLVVENLRTAKSPISALPKNTFRVFPKHDGVAYYDIQTIDSKYKSISDELLTSEAGGLNNLRRLISAHLQGIWQNTFSGGVAVLQHLPQHGNILVESSMDIARNLTECLDSPLRKSCPPNNPKCTPCNPLKPLPIQLSQSYRNTSDVFSIGLVPHPYTTTSLHYFKDSLDTAFVRRNTTRDDWLVTVSKGLVTPVKDSHGALSGPQLLVRFKDVVASEHGASHSLWLTPEAPKHDSLEWLFGFPVPADTAEDKRPAAPKPVGEIAAASDLTREQQILESATRMVKAKHREAAQTRAMVEAWNMADAEAWRFVMAFNARRKVERLKWEEEEREFAGAEKRVKGWGGWFGTQ